MASCFFSSGGSFSASDISASTLNDGEGGGYVRALRVQFPSTVDLLASKVSSPHCLLAFLLVVAAILRGGSAERPLPAPQLNFAFYNIFFWLFLALRKMNLAACAEKSSIRVLHELLMHSELCT